MALVQAPVDVPPPFKLTSHRDGSGLPLYAWDISDSEHARLSAVFGRNFSDCKVAGTYVTASPRQCVGCGKWTEFIDWVFTALKREVHSPTFMFNALKNRQLPEESAHDVYCSGCGNLTHARSRKAAEGGAPNVFKAGPLKKYQNAQKAATDNAAQEEDTTAIWASKPFPWLYSEKQASDADSSAIWASKPFPWLYSEKQASDADSSAIWASKPFPWLYAEKQATSDNTAIWASKPFPWLYEEKQADASDKTRVDTLTE